MSGRGLKLYQQARADHTPSGSRTGDFESRFSGGRRWDACRDLPCFCAERGAYELSWPSPHSKPFPSGAIWHRMTECAAGQSGRPVFRSKPAPVREPVREPEMGNGELRSQARDHDRGIDDDRSGDGFGGAGYRTWQRPRRHRAQLRQGRWFPCGQVEVVQNETARKTRSDEACRYYTLSNPLLFSEMTVGVSIDSVWTNTNAVLTLGRVTFMLEPTTTDATPLS